MFVPLGFFGLFVNARFSEGNKKRTRVHLALIVTKSSKLPS